MTDLIKPLGAGLRAPTGHTLTTLYYRGKLCWIAQEIGQALGYSKNGSRLSEKIASEWAEEVIEGEDFFKVEGEELAGLRAMLADDPTDSVGSSPLNPKTARLLLLTEQGTYLACIKSNKPAGVQLRRWLVSEVLPALRATGSYTTAKAAPAPSPEPKRLSASRKRLSVDASEEVVEELRTICFWRGDQVSTAVSEAVATWVQAKHAARDFFIDPETRRPVEKPAGEPYPPRTGEPKLGRPLKR